jgi:hypothetical protein
MAAGHFSQTIRVETLDICFYQDFYTRRTKEKPKQEGT